MKLIGITRLGRDAEIRHTASGKQVASLALAYDYGMKGENGKSQRNGYRPRFGATSRALQQYLTKGNRAVCHPARCAYRA